MAWHIFFDLRDVDDHGSNDLWDEKKKTVQLEVH